MWLDQPLKLSDQFALRGRLPRPFRIDNGRQ
jgi:hypothetical protein